MNHKPMFRELAEPEIRMINEFLNQWMGSSFTERIGYLREQIGELYMGAMSTHQQLAVTIAIDSNMAIGMRENIQDDCIKLLERIKSRILFLGALFECEDDIRGPFDKNSKYFYELLEKDLKMLNLVLDNKALLFTGKAISVEHMKLFTNELNKQLTMLSI